MGNPMTPEQILWGVIAIDSILAGILTVCTIKAIRTIRLTDKSLAKARDALAKAQMALDVVKQHEANLRNLQTDIEQDRDDRRPIGAR